MSCYELLACLLIIVDFTYAEICYDRNFSQYLRSLKINKHTLITQHNIQVHSPCSLYSTSTPIYHPPLPPLPHMCAQQRHSLIVAVPPRACVLIHCLLIRCLLIHCLLMYWLCGILHKYRE